MDIKVKVNKYEKDNLKGFASVVFDDCFVVKNIKIMDGKNGLFVAMPSYKSNDKYVDIANPTTDEFRNTLQSKILDAYNNLEKNKDTIKDYCKDKGSNIPQKSEEMER